MTRTKQFHEPREVFDWIVEYKRTHNGNSPAVHDIARAFNFNQSVAYYHLNRLKKQGKLDYTPRVVRSLTIPHSQWEHTPPINIGRLSAAENKWLNDYYGHTCLEPMHLDELADGSMTFAEAAKKNIQWYEDHTVEALHAIDTPPVDDEDTEEVELSPAQEAVLDAIATGYGLTESDTVIVHPNGHPWLKED